MQKDLLGVFAYQILNENFHFARGSMVKFVELVDFENNLLFQDGNEFNTIASALFRKNCRECGMECTTFIGLAFHRNTTAMNLDDMTADS